MLQLKLNSMVTLQSRISECNDFGRILKSLLFTLQNNRIALDSGPTEEILYTACEHFIARSPPLDQTTSLIGQQQSGHWEMFPRNDSTILNV